MNTARNIEKYEFEVRIRKPRKSKAVNDNDRKELEKIAKEREKQIKEELKAKKELRQERYENSDIYDETRETNFPTVDIAGAKSEHIARRGLQDNRIQKRIDKFDCSYAAEQIAKSYHEDASDVIMKSPKIADFVSCSRGGSYDNETLQYLERQRKYPIWLELCRNNKPRKIPVGIIIDIVCCGKNLTETNLLYGKHEKSTFAGKNLIKGLLLYKNIE